MVPLDKQYIDKIKVQELLVANQEEITHKQVEKYLLDKNIRVIDIDIYEEMQSELEELKNSATLSKTETVHLSQKTANELNRYKELGYSLKDLLVIAGSKQTQEKYARAWLDGYEVEEEQKYYVINNDHRMMLVRMMDGKTITEADPFKLEDMYEVEKKSHRLTEQEIKDYDERYFSFAVKVEELEE